MTPRGLNDGRNRRATRMDLAGLTLLAAVLRLHTLNAQFWSDEIAALHHRFQKPFAEILTGHAAFLSHPLYELLARASLLVFGPEPWAVRLPAALFGIASVPVLYLIARRLSSRAEALLAGGLMAVSYHHLFFSQDARGYTAMIFFYLVATLLLLRLPDGFSSRARVAYAGAAVLGAYSVPFGAFVPAGHLAVALPTTAVWRRRGNTAAPCSRSLALLFCGIGALVLLLYLPLLTYAFRFATGMGRAPESGERFSLAMVPELLEGLRAGLGGPAGLLAGLIVGLIGLADLVRRHPLPFALLTAPAAATAAVLAVLEVGAHPRYLIVVLPAGILVAARGMTVLACWAARAAGRAGARAPAALGYAAVVVVVLTAATPLARYYRVPRQDFVGALRVVRELAAPGDRVAAAQVAGHILNSYYHAGFQTLESLDDLLRMERTGGRLWVITTVERVLRGYAPGLVEYLRKRYTRVRVLPATLGDGEMRIYVGNAGPGDSTALRPTGSAVDGATRRRAGTSEVGSGKRQAPRAGEPEALSGSLPRLEPFADAVDEGVAPRSGADLRLRRQGVTAEAAGQATACKGSRKPLTTPSGSR